MTIWPMILASTFFDTRLAVGPLGWIRGNGAVLPTVQDVNDEPYPSTIMTLTCDCDRNDDEEINVQELRIISDVWGPHSLITYLEVSQ